MTTNSPDKNNINDNNNMNINSNNNKNNNKSPQKSGINDQFIFFKEDILKDIKKIESKLSFKYDIQFNLNSNKINKVDSKNFFIMFDFNKIPLTLSRQV